jgi:hypothetical protein
MSDLIVPKRLLSVCVTIPDAEHFILLIPLIWPPRLRAFGGPEGMLQGSSFDEFDEPDEILSAIQKILWPLDPGTVDAVFQQWMIQLQKCIDGNGEYVE